MNFDVGGDAGLPSKKPWQAPWIDAWFSSTQPRSLRAWRAVEAQHVVATMRLVDTLAEQAVLEQLLDASKPAMPPGTEGQHYLLATPFRYRPPHGSRFRRAHTRGVWYGAEQIRTACAEVAYWRWRFLMDSSGLQDQELLTEHTLFAAQLDGPSIDLLTSPWAAAREHWTHSTDYAPTQALADAAVQRGVHWLRHESVRDEGDQGGVCCAVFKPQALTRFDSASQQTWHCRTTRHAVRMVHDSDRFEWQMGATGRHG